MMIFHIDSNGLSGQLPDFSTAFPNLQELNLSNQKLGNTSGFIGTIPPCLSNLPFRTALNDAGNKLMGSIPRELGNFHLIEMLDLSDNKLSQTIPSELGKLVGK